MPSDFRGAVVEDLQLSPALVLSADTSAGTALRMAFERDFSILPVSDPTTRRLRGWIDISLLKDQIAKGIFKDEDVRLGDLDVVNGTGREMITGGALKKFAKTKEYQVITPDTPLEDLESFFEKGKATHVTFALVTDSERKFVLGIVTEEDLQKFISRRNPGKP